MNFLVIATHHGAFLTLESVFEKMEDGDKVYAFVPQSQIDKYSEFEEDIFKNYTKHLNRYAKKRVDFYALEHDMHNPVSSVCEFARMVGIEGPTLVLTAGAILNKIDRDWVEERMKDKRFLFTSTRTFKGKFDMYGELGLPTIPFSQDFYNLIFFVNPDHLPKQIVSDLSLYADSMSKKLSALMEPKMFTRNDALIGNALSTVEALRFGTASLNAIAWYHWGVAMKHPETVMYDEYYAYPLDAYAEYAKKVKEYLPPTTYERIIENGKESAGTAQKLRELDV